MTNKTCSAAIRRAEAIVDRFKLTLATITFSFHPNLGCCHSLVFSRIRGWLHWPNMQKYEKLEKIGEGKFQTFVLVNFARLILVSLAC